MNPMQMFQMIRQVNNPNQVMQYMRQMNPQGYEQFINSDMYKNAVQMNQNGNMNGLQSLVRNAYQNKGMNLQQMMQMFGRR